MFVLVLESSFVGSCVSGVEVAANLVVALAHVFHVDTNIPVAAVGHFVVWIWVGLTSCENFAQRLGDICWTSLERHQLCAVQLGQLRQNLDPTGSIADDCDAFVAIVIVVVPLGRMSLVTFEVVDAGNGRPFPLTV